MKKLLWFLIPLGLLIGGITVAVNVTIPQSTSLGSVPIGNTNGTYNSGFLVAGSNITINTSTAGQISISASASGGSGNSAWTIGNGLIYNATSTDSVLVGTTTPATAKLFVQGSGTKNPLMVASSSGANFFTVTSAGNVGINGASPSSLLTVAGINASGVPGTPDLFVKNLITNGSPVLGFANSSQQYNFGINGSNANELLLYDITASRTDLVVLTNGRFGINTSTPQATFSINGLANVDPFIVTSSSGLSILTVKSASQVLLDPTARLTIPQGTAPTLSTAGDIAMDTTNDQFLYGATPNVLTATSTKTMTISAPTSSDDFSMTIFEAPITITGVRCNVTSTSSNSPSWTFNLPHGTSRAAAGSAGVFTAGQACTATTTPQIFSPTGDVTLAAGEVLWATSSAVSNASTSSVTIYFKYDRQ